MNNMKVMTGMDKTSTSKEVAKPIRYEVWLEQDYEPLGVFDTKEEAIKCKSKHQWRYISRTVYIKEAHNL